MCLPSWPLYDVDRGLAGLFHLPRGSSTSFADYLKSAWTQAREDAASGKDNGDLEHFHALCRRDVLANWSALTPVSFLESYHRCVAAVAKEAATVEKNLPRQVALFRNHDARRIVDEGDAIRAEWRRSPQYLSPKMVEAVIGTAALIAGRWEQFRAECLVLPSNPETESLQDWAAAHAALDRLPMVGEATAWYLIRNLYGARVFKPDVHILAIAWHFFPQAATPLEAMSQAVGELWKAVCDDKRFLPVHLGEVDYVLWRYRKTTGSPEAAVSASC